MKIEYCSGNTITLDQMIDLYHASTLGERRPADDRQRMEKMLNNANLIVTAWDGPQLVGIARSLTDFAFCTYLSDLAVRVSHQRQGIGKELIAQTRKLAGPDAKIILLSAPKAVEYYPRVGFTQHPSAWVL